MTNQGHNQDLYALTLDPQTKTGHKTKPNDPQPNARPPTKWLGHKTNARPTTKCSITNQMVRSHNQPLDLQPNG